MNTRTMLGLALAASGLLATGGCQTSTSQSTAALASPTALYERGEYDQAERQAADLARTSTGTTRAQASYVAGLAAYQQGNSRQAAQHLAMAEHASDSDASGRASAMLGVIALDAGDNRQAAAHFDRAAQRLHGYQRDQAERYARQARHASGTQVNLRTTRGGDDGRFCLQAGAFRDRTRAARTSAQLEHLAREAGLGSVRVVPRDDTRGQRLYVVQIGGFHTRSEASRARQAIGRLDFIVASSDM